MPKYNIALIPTQNTDQFIHYAHQLSKSVSADKYHITMAGSIPHISLCHFFTERDNLHAIWQQLQALALPRLYLTFDHHLSKGFPGNPKYRDMVWVSLMPNKRDQLTQRHLLVADIIQQPLNAAFEYYDPHMTLFNSRAKAACAQLNQRSQITPALEDDFVLALGPIDDVGQLMSIHFKEDAPATGCQ